MAVTLEGALLEAYLDNGKRLALKNGRFLVPLPAPLRYWVPDLKRVRSLAGQCQRTDIADRAGKIQDALNVAASCTIHLVPPGGPAFQAKLPRQAYSTEAESMALWQAAAVLDPAVPVHRELQKAAESLVQQGSDLRLNFPKETLPHTGVGGCRFVTSIGRAGAAAAQPNEKFEVAFYNFNGFLVRGAISVTLPAVGWQVKAVGKTDFEGLPPGKRFVAEYQLTGVETCTHQGELTATVEYEVQGVKLQKQTAFKLFAPWLGIGPFCDKKEKEKDSLSLQLATLYPPEKRIDPKAVYERHDGKKIAWTPVRSLYGYPGIDVAGQFHWGQWNQFLAGTQTEVFTPWPSPAPVYFAQWIYSPEKRDVALLPIFCSKVAKVWVNQKAIFEWDTDNKPGVGMNWTQVRTWYGVPRTIPTTLAKGWNEVLFKITNHTIWGDPSAFGCQILDRDLRSIPGLLGSIVRPH